MPSTKRRIRHRTKPHPLGAKIGKRIKALRTSLGHNFDSFVESTGLSRGFAAEVEKGISVPTVTSLRKIAAGLEVHVADLLLLDGSKREKLIELSGKLTDEQIGKLIRDAERFAVENAEK